MNELKIQRLTSSARLPVRATSGSVGYDISADIPASIVIKPGETIKIPTGIAMEIESGFVGLIYARSGLSTNFGISLANGVGVIDCDYRQEVLVPLHNQSNRDYELAPFERIAQLVLSPVFTPLLVECDVGQTSRGGFGSTLQ